MSSVTGSKNFTSVNSRMVYIPYNTRHHADVDEWAEAYPWAADRLLENFMIKRDKEGKSVGLLFIGTGGFEEANKALWRVTKKELV